MDLLYLILDNLWKSQLDLALQRLSPNSHPVAKVKLDRHSEGLNKVLPRRRDVGIWYMYGHFRLQDVNLNAPT